MSSFRSAFPSKYLKADDLGGRPVLGTIASVTTESIGTGADKADKLVCRFAESSLKPTVLNMSNSISIAAVSGTDDVDDWPGTKIVLFPTTVFYQGKDTPCVRIRAPKPKAVVAPKVAPPPPVEDDGPPTFGIEEVAF